MKILKILLVCFLSLAWQVSYAQNVKKWRPDSLLQWSDYLGKPEADSKPDDGALSSTGVGFSYKLLAADPYAFKFDVFAFFLRDKSWVRENKKLDWVLKHEQLHFDIAQVFARRFLKAVNAYHFTSDYKNEIQQVYDQNRKEKIDFQAKYDSETDHGLNLHKQMEWDVYVKVLIDME